MPRNNKNRSRAKKGRRKRRGGGRPPGYAMAPEMILNTRTVRMNVPRGVVGGVPDVLRVKLRYVETFALTPASGLMTSRTYGLNCLYDPYLALGGHQPANFDFWMQQYGFYCGMGATVEFAMFSNNSSSGIPAAYGFLLSDTGTVVSPSSALESILEQKFCAYSPVNAGIVNGPFPGVVRGRTSIPKWFGASQRTWASNPSGRGTASTNPTEIVYLEVWAGSVLGNTPSANATQFRLVIDFEVEFSSPIRQIYSRSEWDNRHSMKRKDTDTFEVLAADGTDDSKGP